MPETKAALRRIVGGITGVLVACIVVAGCGFQPMYATDRGTGRADVSSNLQNIFIPVSRGRVEQLVYNNLRDRLNPLGVPRQPRFRLDYAVTVLKQPVAFAKDETATRQNVRVSVTFSLKDRSDNAVAFSGTARAFAAYNILRSQYATLAAEQNAEDRAVREVSDEIRLRIAAYFSGTAES